MPKVSYFAVARGRNIGIVTTWEDCKKQVEKFPNARYKKFIDKGEAEAFIQEHSNKGNTSKRKYPDKEDEVISVKQAKYDQGIQLGKPTSSKISYYAVAKGWSVGIYTTWTECKEKIDGYPHPCFRKFEDKEAANVFIREYEESNSKKQFKVTDESDGRVIEMKSAPTHTDSNFGVNSTKFTTDEEGYVLVYTDGACRSNGRKGAKAGIGVWFGDNHPLNISAPIKGTRHTNNTAEIQAAEQAILKAKEVGIKKLIIKTDSQFVINCITKWIRSWKNNGWKLSDGNSVKNREDLERLSNATSGLEIKWSYVPGHKGFYGNEQADKLAVIGSEK